MRSLLLATALVVSSATAADFGTRGGPEPDNIDAIVEALRKDPYDLELFISFGTSKGGSAGQLALGVRDRIPGDDLVYSANFYADRKPEHERDFYTDDLMVRIPKKESRYGTASSLGAKASFGPAGLACMSEVMITGEGDFTVIRASAVETKPGLGFVRDAIVDQHFVTRQRLNRLLSAALEHRLPGIGVDEQTEIWIQPDGTIEVSGERSVVVVDPRRAAVRTMEEERPRFGAHGPAMPGPALISPEIVDARWKILPAVARDQLLDAGTERQMPCYAHNVEHFVGTVKVPVGIAGPLSEASPWCSKLCRWKQ